MYIKHWLNLIGLETGFYLEDKNINVLLVGLEEIYRVSWLTNYYLDVFSGEELNIFVIDYVVISEFEGNVQYTQERWGFKLGFHHEILTDLIIVLLAGQSEWPQPRINLNSTILYEFFYFG